MRMRRLVGMLGACLLAGLCGAAAAAADVTPPTVAITAPAEGTTVFGGLSVTAEASDDTGVVGVQFFKDGAPLGAEDTSAPYAVPWQTTSADNGSHTLTAQARDAVGQVTLSAPVTVTVLNDGSPAQIGQWATPVTNLPIVPVHMTLLPTGRVLMWDSSDDHDGPPPDITPRLWDPATNSIVDVPRGESVLFCAHHALLPGNRFFVSGGHGQYNEDGAVQASFFNILTNAWSRVADMRFPRWYPTDVLLGDGRVLTLSGYMDHHGIWADLPEIYDPAADRWTLLREIDMAAFQPTLSEDYLATHLLPDGTVHVMNPDNGQSRRLDVTARTWEAGPTAALGWFTSTMYRPGRLLITGGGDLALSPDAQKTALTLDTAQPAAVWQPTSPMHFPRYQHNLVLLPDGTVMAVGGLTVLDKGVSDAATLEAEVWNPETGAWTQLSAMQVPRLYHSTALLLPDGRVVAAGGGGLFPLTNHPDTEFYSPAYLFRGPRPVITSAPAAIAYGESFAVITPDAEAVTAAALIPLGSVTHTVDSTQRYVPLSFTAGAGQLQVQAPSDPHVAPPTYYMLFILNGAGVPSVASIVELPAEAAAAEEPVEAYLEAGGQVVMEAELYDEKIARGGHDWLVQVAKGGYSGEGYVQVLPDVDDVIDAGHVGTAAELVFNVQFTTPGTYYVWLRGHGDDGGDDSAHAGLDGASPASADRISGFFKPDWVWQRDTRDGPVATLTVPTPGLHTFHLWMREDGMKVDKILLRLDGTSTAPMGLGPAESARVEAGSPPPMDTTDPVITGIAASGITTTGATITWTTDEPASSQVDYGTSTAYGTTTPLDAALVTSHSVSLTGLTPGTDYHFQVRSTDAAGNPATSADAAFQTTPSGAGGPQAFQEAGGQVVMEAEHYDGKVARAGKDWLTETAKTGYAGAGYVQVLPDTDVVVDAGYVGTVAELIFNVQFATPGTYYVWLRGHGDDGGDDSAHAGLNGASPASADKITGFFKPDWTWLRSTKDGPVATLTVPTPGLHTFHLWMREDGMKIDKILLRLSSSSTAPAGQGPAESARVDPEAPPPQDTTDPVITGVAASGITTASATITWTTDEPATSQVDYGTDTGYGSTTPLDGALVTSHSVTLTGLAADGDYHFRVRSADASDNEAVSTDNVFSTAAPSGGGGEAFQESGGQVVMEAEHYDDKIARGGVDWALSTGASGYSGEGAMQALPNSGTTINAGYVDTSPELVYNVDFTTTGTYYLWLRGQAPGGADDSGHAGLDGAGPSSADRLTGFGTAWSWRRSTMDGPVATLNITTPGRHTIHLWMREDGLRIDKLLLRTSSASSAPSGVGPAESPRSSGPGSDTDDPVISARTVAAVTATTATITWITDEPATSRVDFGPSAPAYEQSSPLDAELVNAHRVTLTGLTPGTLLHFRVRSNDASGNEAASGDGTFTTNALDQATFFESNGQVVIEAEHFDRRFARGGKDWALQAGNSGFSGTGYLEVLPNTGTSVSTGYVGTAAEVVYQVQFDTAGTYYLWLRGQADNGSDDSLHAGVDGAGPASAQHITGFTTSWGWRGTLDGGALATLTIPSAGLHTIHLWMRQDGLRVDRILLRTSSSPTAPAGVGPVEYNGKPRLLSLGDSITRGSADPDGFGYRDHLQALLGLGAFEWVGATQSPSSDPAFDVDTGGVNGDRTDQVLARLPDLLATHTPLPSAPGSNVLLHIGTNDLNQGVAEATVVNNVEAIIEMIDAHDPNLTVYVARIIPSKNTTLNAKIPSYNAALAARVNALKAGGKSNLYLLDMNAAFTQNDSWAAQYMADSVHPNDLGYQVMADTWKQALDLNP